ALAGGALRFCVLDVAGEATAAALARYVGAAGYTVLQRDARLTTDEIAQAALICADADRLATFDLPADRRRPPMIAVCPLGDDATASAGPARPPLPRPPLRAEGRDPPPRPAHSAPNPPAPRPPRDAPAPPE